MLLEDLWHFLLNLVNFSQHGKFIPWHFVMLVGHLFIRPFLDPFDVLAFCVIWWKPLCCIFNTSLLILIITRLDSKVYRCFKHFCHSQHVCILIFVYLQDTERFPAWETHWHSRDWDFYLSEHMYIYMYINTFVNVRFLSR